MRILQINMTCGIGSTGRIAVDISDVLNRNSIENYIAYGFYKTELPNTYKIINGSKLHTVYFALMYTRLTGWHGNTKRSETKRFIQWIEKKSPDIIHLQNIHGGYINVEILFDYLRKFNGKIVWTLHDCWPFTGHCAYFDYIVCDKWKKGCHDCKNLVSYPKSYFFDHSETQWKLKKNLFTGLNNLVIVTPSKWLANLVADSILNIYEVRIINNGVDTSVFKSVKSNIKGKLGIKKKMILGVASSWSQRKGLKYFYELLELLNDEYQIVLVGLNKKQIKEIPNNIIGIERTNNVTELVELYSAADVFVNPTLEDNYPTTNLEAIACGTPVVTFITGGSAECINDKTGLAVEKGNVSELADAIKKVCNTEYDKVVCQYYARDKKQMAKDYVALYKER